ncbi:GNAT family N-acetyltransferase [Jeongeupia naejangsanensis]|uniref:GNAT family N-acetyltransferase n=1 Tax=Jeongeupia naejangsanensis TaxID=613195 RepID=A0ABS2BGL5_9NEIS|nr:GNAT family N-acetyltransferase [Jeongeupia naejangsanensis]MBM3114736.1 GNAT family N-acetyltransferase [Jeongeupia naejangsanensis]
MRFSIRPAAPDDVAEILTMVRELAEFEQLSHLVTGSVEKLHEDLFGAHPACECLIGEADGETAAFALYFHNYSTFLTRRGLYLEDLYVRPAYRGRGYAKAIMVHLAQLARERGCGRFEWSVLDWNANAIAFYQSIGATVLPDWRVCRVTGPALETLASR